MTRENDALRRIHESRVAAAVAEFLDEPGAEHVELCGENPLLVALAHAARVPGLDAYAPLFEAAWSAVTELRRDDDPLRRLLAEHCRLFVGPSTPLASPFAHAYDRGADPFAAAVEARRTMAALGLAIRPGCRAAADHISVALEIFAQLTDAGRFAQAERFHADHLANAASGLAAAISDATTCPLHAAIAGTLDRLSHRASTPPPQTRTRTLHGQETRS